MLCVRSDPAARLWRVWRAESDDRDFRDAKWQTVAESSRAAARFVMREPAQAYAAVVGEAAFGARLRAFTLSTSLNVVAAANEPAYGTHPAGESGLCAQLESTPVVPMP
jgi:hypothetical protein